MKRTALAKLLAWKNQSTRKPILLDGARQTGKSYLLEKIFGEHFKQVIRPYLPMFHNNYPEILMALLNVFSLKMSLKRSTDIKHLPGRSVG